MSFTDANMLYLESPAGVGFSFSGNKSFYDSVTDDMTGLSTSIFPKCFTVISSDSFSSEHGSFLSYK